MKKVIKLTESDLRRIVKRVIKEHGGGGDDVARTQNDPLAKAIKLAIFNCYKSNPKRTQRSDDIANQIFDSLNGLGTDEEKLYKSLKLTKDMNEFCSVCVSYEKITNEDLWVGLYGDISYSDNGQEEWSKVFRSIPGIKA